MDWSLVADWVSGLASLFAAGTALYFWYSDKRERTIEQRTNVAAWVQKSEIEPNRWVLRTINNTATPIWKWRVLVSSVAQGEECYFELLSSDEVGLIPPGDYQFPWEPGDFQPRESTTRIRFYFVDAMGTEWVRVQSGGLVKLTDIDADIEEQAGGYS